MRAGIDIGIDAHRDRARCVPVSTASRDSSSSSGSDSTLMQRMSAASAARSSASVLPTPENRIFCGGMPAASARFNSPPETTSAPAPSFASVRSTDWLEFAFMA